MMFDPVRITRLHLRTSEAVEALLRIDAPDPAADHAIACCRRMSLTLSEMWLPMLRDVMDLHSFSHYETVLRTEAVPSYSHYSQRFASRSAGRVRSVEMRRERARRAAEKFCLAPWVTSHHPTSWTWEDLNDALDQVKKAIRRGTDPTSGLQLLLEVQRMMTSDFLGFSSSVLQSSGLRVLNGPNSTDIFKKIFAAIEPLFDPYQRSRLGTHPHYENFEELKGPIGEFMAMFVNFCLGQIDPMEANHEFVQAIVQNPVLLRLLEPNLQHLDDQQISVIAEAGLELETRTPIHGQALPGHGDHSSTVTILIEILDRGGGPAAIAASPAASAKLFGRSIPHGQPTAATMFAALRAASERIKRGESVEVIDLHDQVGRLELLAVATAHLKDDSLDPPVSRALALTFAPILDDLSPYLDREHVVVTPRWADPSEFLTVSIGSRKDLATLLGRIMTDADSQLILGLAAGQVVTQSGEIAAEVLLADERDIDAPRYLQAQLAEAHKLVTFLRDSRGKENEHLAFEHGLSVSRGSNVVNVITAPFSIGGLHINALVHLSTPALLSALGLNEPPKVPSFGLDSDLAILHTATALRVPIDYPELRERLGVDDVPPEVWQQCADLLERLDESSTPEMRTVAMSQITAHAQNDPSIHGYINAMRIGSGAL
jgi:hypothetical protein